MVANLKIVNKDGKIEEVPRVTTAGWVSRSDGANLRYVEDKPYDMDKVTQLLSLSQKHNHWTNFGPVSRELERAIASKLELDSHLRVVMCASGAAAQHAIIALHETLAGSSLRWATSSFGFYSAIQGPLNTAQIVDCDSKAMLDLSQLDPSTIDGFIVTNIFGQADNLDQYYRYAATHGKIVCVDAAMAFASHRHGANECISFHHTKPWGFGEGGCAIVAEEHEDLLRSLISFGHEVDKPINRRAFNGKISDVSCAFIRERLNNMENLGAHYLEQYERIVTIGRRVGMAILADVDLHPGIPASVPLLAPLPFTDYRHPVIPTGRYYFPLANTPVARDIYSRIVNIPCHAGMKAVSDAEIKAALEGFIQRAFVESGSLEF